jgi:hypothetical protein
MAITKIMLKSDMPPKLLAIGRHDLKYYEWTYIMQKNAYNLRLFLFVGKLVGTISL